MRRAGTEPRRPPVAGPEAAGAGSGRMLDAMYDRLYAAFGPQGWWPAESPWEMAVSAILVQRVHWSAVERALRDLARFHLWEAADILKTPDAVIGDILRPTLYYRQKTRRLKALAELVVEMGATAAEGMARLLALPPEALRERLLAVPGIGPETADDIMLYGAGYARFVVDRYTHRILSRVGWLYPAPYDYERIQRAIMRVWPQDVARYQEMHALLVRLGRAHCRTRPRCEACPLADHCAYALSGGVNDGET